MKENSNPGFPGWVAAFLGAVALVKLFWVAAGWLVPLPVQGVEHTGISLRHTLRYPLRLASDVQQKLPRKAAHKSAVSSRSSLSGYKLIGIYSSAPHAVVTLVRGMKSFVLTNGPKGGTVQGYRLKDANATAARFEKGDSILVLKLFEEKRSAASRHSAIRTITTPQTMQKEKENKAPIHTEGDTTVIDRSLIQEYTENPDKIWKNIGLYEVKSNGKLDGFKVRFVRRGSPFAKLGLKRGDIIKSINGEPIVDYATPMRMLRSADTIDDLSITVERNHEEQELKYEVK